MKEWFVVVILSETKNLCPTVTNDGPIESGD